MPSDDLLVNDKHITGEQALQIIDSLQEQETDDKEKKFVCRICGEVFSSLAEIGTHMKKDHSEEERKAVPSKWGARKRKSKTKTSDDTKSADANESEEPMMAKLRSIMKTAGARVRIDNIIDIFQHYDPTDLERLGELLTTFDYSVPIRSAILENWANYLGIEVPDEVIETYMASRMKKRYPNLNTTMQPIQTMDPLDKLQLEEEQELAREMKRNRIELKIQEQRQRMNELKKQTFSSEKEKEENIIYVPDASGNIVPVKASMFTNFPMANMFQPPRQNNSEIELLKDELRLLREELTRKEQEKQLNSVMGYVDEKIDNIAKLLEKNTYESEIQQLRSSFESKLESLVEKLGANHGGQSQSDDLKMLDAINNLRMEISEVSKDVDARINEMKSKSELDNLRTEFSNRLEQINNAISRRYATDAATAEIQESASLLRDGIGSFTDLGKDIIALEARKNNLLSGGIPNINTVDLNKRLELPRGTEQTPVPRKQYSTSQEFREKLEKLKAWRASRK